MDIIDRAAPTKAEDPLARIHNTPVARSEVLLQMWQPRKRISTERVTDEALREDLRSGTEGGEGRHGQHFYRHAFVCDERGDILRELDAEETRF